MFEGLKVFQLINEFRTLLGFTHVAHVFYFSIGVFSLYMQQRKIIDLDKRLHALDEPKEGRVNKLSELCKMFIVVQADAMIKASTSNERSETILQMIKKIKP